MTPHEDFGPFMRAVALGLFAVTALISIMLARTLMQGTVISDAAVKLIVVLIGAFLLALLLVLRVGPVEWALKAVAKRLPFFQYGNAPHGD